MLGKLYIPPTTHLPDNTNTNRLSVEDPDLIEKVHTLATRVVEEKNLLPDAVSRNAASKLLTAVEKLLDAVEQTERDQKNSTAERNEDKKEEKEESVIGGNDTILEQEPTHLQDAKRREMSSRPSSASVKMETERDELQDAAVTQMSILDDESILSTVKSSRRRRTTATNRTRMTESESLLDDLLDDDDDELEQDEMTTQQSVVSQLTQVGEDEEEEEL